MAASNLCVCVLLALLAGNLILAEEQEKNSFMDPFGFFSSFFGNSRQKRSTIPEDQAVATGNSSDEHQDRFLFSLFNFRITSCNYSNANETGLTCRDCRTALRCLPNNRGIERTCRGRFQYCSSGHCSFLRGSACNSTG